jgi:hypothetical protein
LVADAHDGFWAVGSGRLTRLDGSGAPTASWTFADDEFFASSGMVAARAGGVWLFGGPCIAWFDGRRFRDVIPAPVPVPGAVALTAVAEAADGSLWAVTIESVAAPDGSQSLLNRVLHWNGRSWQEIHSASTVDQPSSLAIDARGRVWLAPADEGGHLAYFDGRAWSSPSDAVLSTGLRALVPAADGSLWSVSDRLAHVSSTSWTTVSSRGLDLTSTNALAVSPGGTVWAATGSATLPGETDPHVGVEIARYDGHAWTVYGTAQGLPAPQSGVWATVTGIAASRTTVVAATRDGFYRFSGGRWSRVGPPPAQPTSWNWPSTLLAVSADEAWVGTFDAGLWHIQGSAWTSVPVADWEDPLRVSGIARSPEGALAVATDRGAAVLREGRWTVLEGGRAGAVAFDGDGAIWVVGIAGETSVASFRFDGRAWVRTPHPAPTLGGDETELVVGPDGKPWVGSVGWVGSLDRFDGARWVHENPLGRPDLMVSGLAIAPNGDVWVATTSLGGDEPAPALARYNGSAWTAYRTSTDPPEPWFMRGVAVAPDGRPWVASDRGLASLDGQQWSVRYAGYPFGALSFAPDGTLWTAGPSGVQREAGNVVVTVAGLTAASGSRLVGFLFPEGSDGNGGLGGFAVPVDADPFNVTALMHQADADFFAPSWPDFSPTVVTVPAGTYTLRLWASRTLGPYSDWLPGDQPDLRGCHVVVKVAAGQRTDVHLTDVPVWGPDPTCPSG